MAFSDVWENMRGAALAPFGLSLVTLAAALVALVFGLLSLGPHHNARLAAAARQAASEIDRRIADAVMLRQVYLITGDSAFAQRSDSIFDQLPPRIAQLDALAQARAAHEERAAIEEGAAAARELSQALPQDEAWRDDGPLGVLRRASSLWTGAIERALSEARARADASAARLGASVLALVFSALALTIAQGRDALRRLGKAATERAEAMSRAEDLRRDLDQSRLNLEMVNERLELALSAAGVLVFSQDSELRYDWVSRGDFGRAAEEIVGLDDAALFGAQAARVSVAAKREALDLGRLTCAEIQVVDRGAPRWIELHVGPLRPHGVGADRAGGVLGAMIDVTQPRLDRESNSWLMRELSHRTQNLLAIVQSMARHTARTSVNGKQFITRFRDRLAALSAAHYLLVRNSFRGVDLEELVRSQLLESDRLIGQRVRLSGPPVALRPDSAQNFAMAVSELSSNALAHGALAAGDGEGEVEASWRIEEAGGGARLVFVWNERPTQARAPARAPGFGSVIVKRMAPRALQARVTLDHRAEGTVCTFDMPFATVAVGMPAPQAGASQAGASQVGASQESA